VRLRVATVAVVVILKALAMADRDKPKDAYDLDYLLWHADGELTRSPPRSLNCPRLSRSLAHSPSLPDF